METTSLTQTNQYGLCVASQHANAPSLRCRKAERTDVKELSDIENLCFDSPWTSREFEYCLSDKRCEGLVVEYENEILGYLFYEKNTTSFTLLNCATTPYARRRGVGSALIRELIANLKDTRKEISCVIRESNVQAQIFLRTLGFRAQWVLRGFYSDSSEDAYKMCFQTEEWALATEYIRKRLLTR